MPERIQLSRAKGWRMPANTVKVDRTTRYGNPFRPQDVFIAGESKLIAGQPIGVDGAVKAFRNLMALNVRKEPEKTQVLLDELRGKNLACWCKLGTPCHADVLLELSNAPEIAAAEISKATAQKGVDHDQG